MLRWCSVLLVALVIGGFSGCAGKARSHSPWPDATAGTPALATGGSGADAGEGGSGAEGANAGAPGSGGSPLGGKSGAGGAGGSGGAGASSMAGRAGGSTGGANGGGSALGGGAGTGGSAGSVPAGWTCQAAKYADGKSCDCGCGLVDPDCKDSSIGSCDACNLLGGCAHGPCPSDVVPDDNSRCSLPPTWICSAIEYGDGLCDCGCGALDADCDGKSASACDTCPLFSCAQDSVCTGLDPDDNTVCEIVPSAWKCDDSAYRDGSVCNCGCGFWDPDCTGTGVDACDVCDGMNSCAKHACPSTIRATDNKTCDVGKAPAGWKCQEFQYADQNQCDCGCGAPDPDCVTNDPRECVTCLCGGCPASLDPNDISKCAPPPPEWTCPAEDYATGICHCGCGAMDPSCLDNLYCSNCDDGCAHGHCEVIDQSDITRCSFVVPPGWTCPRAAYGDAVCDCGCGASDPICVGITRSSCESCNTQGSCSKLPCDDPDNQINPTDNEACLR